MPPAVIRAGCGGSSLALEKGPARRSLCPSTPLPPRPWPVRIRAAYISAAQQPGSPAGVEAAAGLGQGILPPSLSPHHEPPVGGPPAPGGGQARLINRGLPSGLARPAASLPLTELLALGPQTPAQLSSGRMAVLHTLWMGLVLLGVLGVLQTQAQAQVSPQPNFQQDKVRCSPARSPRREGGAPWD